MSEDPYNWAALFVEVVLAVVVGVGVAGVGCSLVHARHTMPWGAVGNPLIDK